MTILHSAQPPSPQPTGRSRRPFGLKALIVLLVLQALLSILVVMSLLLVEPLLQSQGNLLSELLDAQVSNVIVYTILAVLRLLVAIGLWRLQRWAWLWMMVQLAVSMAMDIQTYYTGQPIYFSMLLNVILVFYLNQHEVQALFATAEEAEST